MANGLKRKRSRQESHPVSLKSNSEKLEEDAPHSVDSTATLALDGSSNEVTLAVNEEYARRFEHNKKREEFHRLQEKYGKSATSAAVNPTGQYSSSDDSSESEDEDDEGVLASTLVDSQIQETLKAIRRKDPRVYDNETVFFSNEDEADGRGEDAPIKALKPISLSEYHRRNLLHTAEPPLEPQTSGLGTFADEQRDLRKSVISDIQNAAVGTARDDDDHSDDMLLVAKKPAAGPDDAQQGAERALSEDAVRMADEDPDEYLSKYMSARAWIPTNAAKFEPFDSDDEEHDKAAEDFEEAYNLRFEDPSKVNEKLTSHARDVVAKHSVRRMNLNTRQRAREASQQGKVTARQLRKEERARLRKLKVDAVHHKLQQIRDAAGITDEQVQEADWAAFLDAGWDDAQWESEMQKRFGTSYYQSKESPGSLGERAKGRLKKPQWEDDIEIDDLIPSFDANSNGATVADPAGTAPPQQRQTRQDRDDKFERRKIERIVDEQMDAEDAKARSGQKHQGIFRYRDTSPVTFGLTAQDILMASDSQLNQHAGLKKYAAFRDSEKKRKDTKHLSKGARLRKWRKEAFGDEEGSQKTFAQLLEEENEKESRNVQAPQTQQKYVEGAKEGKRKRPLKRVK